MPRRCRKVSAGKGCRCRREKRTLHLRRRAIHASTSPTALEMQVDTAAPAMPIWGRPKIAVDQNGVARDVEKVHHRGDDDYLF